LTFVMIILRFVKSLF